MTGATTCGSASPQYVFDRFRKPTMSNSGMMSAWPGTMRPAMMIPKTTFFPGKSNRENPYAARTHRTSVRTVTIVDTTVEFTIHTRWSPCWNRVR